MCIWKLYIHSSVLKWLNIRESIEELFTMNPILILEYQSLIKENRGHWRNGSFYEHMFVQEYTL